MYCKWKASSGERALNEFTLLETVTRRLMTTSDDRQYLITPLMSHQKTDEYMKDKRKFEREAKTESVLIIF